jgi:Flp pilus assembly protein TadD
MAYHRRSILKGAGLLAGAAVAGVASADPAVAAPADPDQLFRAGRFAAADRAYARLLRTDPQNTHAQSQRGYIALLSPRRLIAADHGYACFPLRRKQA